MTCTLADLLSDLRPNDRQKYLEFPEDIQRDIAGYIMENGTIPSLRRLPILFGPECAVARESRRHGWMVM